MYFGEGNGIPLQCSCLENPMDGGAWWAAVHGVDKSQTQLSHFTFTFHSHALEKEMATHSSGLALRNPRDRGGWWAAVFGVAQSRTQLKRLTSSSKANIFNKNVVFLLTNQGTSLNLNSSSVFIALCSEICFSCC